MFISSPQEYAEQFFEKGWEIKIVAKKLSDSMVSGSKFTFRYVPHDYYQPCVFCQIGHDTLIPGKAQLRPRKGLTRPGLKRRFLEQSTDTAKENRGSKSHKTLQKASS